MEKKRQQRADSDLDRPLADGEMFEALDEYLEEDQEMEDVDELDPDDPEQQEKRMRLQKKSQQIGSIWG